jgi:hypothetical protein
MRCTMCRGDRGASQAYFPNLEGQNASVICMQLPDFHSGARQNEIISAVPASLNEPDMRDLAAYYAHVLRPVAPTTDASVPAPAFVVHGSRMRNIPTCDACHGGIDHKWVARGSTASRRDISANNYKRSPAILDTTTSMGRCAT